MSSIHLVLRLISTLLKLEISTLLKTITNSCFQALEGLKFQALEGLKSNAQPDESNFYHDKKSWFRPKIKKLILARSQNHAFSNHAFSTLPRFQNSMLVRNLAITMHFLGVNGFLWMKSTS